MLDPANVIEMEKWISNVCYVDKLEAMTHLLQYSHPGITPSFASSESAHRASTPVWQVTEN